MTSAAIVLTNLVYVIGAIVAIVVASTIVTLRHRKPKSVEANMASFHKGLRALAPDADPARRPQAPSGAPRAAPRARTVHTVVPARTATTPAAPDSDAGPDRHPTEAETG